ncbi:MAG TPA: SRPBCC domain-containing protein [Micromonosporaceae bacterium]|jgi:uncharacterized protein YndB with AHSA1/START domain
MTESVPLEVTVYIAARPETVFAYFTDPDRYVQWMGSHATLDPVPGGVYRVDVRGSAAIGEFVEIDPPNRIVFTWGWTHDPAVPPGSTRVVVTFRAENSGTRVVLSHHGLPDDEQGRHHREGWQVYLDRLAVRAAGGDPGPDPNA